jgi:predicted permease
MRTIASWWLRRIVGDELARDIEGDVAERGGGPFELAAMVASTLLARVRDASAAVWRALPGGRRSTQDVRQALRSLRHAPAFSFAVVAVIGITGALSTAAFAIVDGVLFKQLPIPNADSLYATSGPGGGGVSLTDLYAWRQAVPDAAIALYGRDFVIGAIGSPRPQPLVALTVEKSFFEVLGERPAAGGFVDNDFDAAGARVRVIISDRLWRGTFNARTNIIGQGFEIAGAADHVGRPLGSFEVAGVLPRDFVFPVNRTTPDLILPLTPPPGQARSLNDLRNYAAGRVLVRTTHAGPAMEAALVAAYGNTPITSAQSDTGSATLSLMPIARYLTLFQHDNLASAFAACSVLMLLAVLNVAALGVLRGQQQLHELAVRRALGATRLDLFRLALADAAPPVVAGMALALVATPWTIAAAMTRFSNGVALLKTPSVDWRVMAFWSALAAVTTLSVAVLRTITVRPAAVAASSKGAHGTTSKRTRFGTAAVAAQVALALVITVGGALVAGSLWRLWQEPIGYSMTRTSLIELSHQAATSAERRAITMSVMDRLRSTRGVESVASIEGAPFLTGSWRSSPIERLPPASTPRVRFGIWPVDTSYFNMLGIRLISGRLFSADEMTAGAPVVVLSKSVATGLFPGGDAVGNSLKRFSQIVSVIGVVDDVQSLGLGYVAQGQIYQPGSLSNQRVVLLVKATTPLDALVAATTTERVGITRATSLIDALGRGNQDRIFRTWLFGAFVLSALIIVAVGTSGIVAMSVGRRTRELGIRSALGATRERLVGMFVREQLMAVVVGLAVGAGVAMWATRFIKAYLFKTQPIDPVLWTLAIVVLLAVSSLAALIPSLRASRINPVDALRTE